MAKVTYGPIVSDVRGVLGSVVFSWAGGASYVKARRAGRNPNSAAQQEQRAAFGVARRIYLGAERSGGGIFALGWRVAAGVGKEPQDGWMSRNVAELVGQTRPIDIQAPPEWGAPNVRIDDMEGEAQGGARKSSIRS